MRTGRPLSVNVERPACPRGHESRTLLDGHYRTPSGRFERPRYRCVSLGGKTLHRFTSELPRRHERTAHGHAGECEACERPLRRNDGDITPRRFGYAVKDIAEILVRLGRGEIYRHLSEDVRTRLGRKALKAQSVWARSRIGDSAAPATHVLDVFAPLVIEHEAPTEWPAIVVLDALPLRSRHRKRRGPKPPPWPLSAKKKRKPQPGAVIEIGRVLVAAGSDHADDPARPIRFWFEGGGDEGAWIAFLRSLPTPPGKPVWVVSDRDQAIENAVAEVWPRAIHYRSHYHLKHNAREALAEDKKLRVAARRELDHLINFMLASQVGYDEARRTARAHGATHLLHWLIGAQGLARQQLVTRVGHEEFPRSSGAAEASIRTIKAAIFSRRHYFTNIDRLNKLLGLIRAQVDHRASEATYARLIREWLRSRDGKVEADWKATFDPWSVRSLDTAIAEAEIRRKGIQSVRQAPVKAANRRRKQVAYDAQRARLGLPLRPRGLPRQVRASGSVAGKSVADYDWLLYQWHPSKNAGVDPATVPAGSGIKLWWKCDRGPDHEWEAQVRSRTMRGVRCPFCTHRKQAPSESFASTHPDIAAEWHPTRNGDKRPADFTYGSQFEAWWQCSLYKTHVYQARISSRTSMMSSCRKCSDLRRRKKRPRRLDTAAAA